MSCNNFLEFAKIICIGELIPSFESIKFEIIQSDIFRNLVCRFLN